MDQFLKNLESDIQSYSGTLSREETRVPSLDVVHKLVRELLDEVICQRAEAVNDADPQTAISKLSHTTEEMEDLVAQIEDLTQRLQLTETKLTETETKDALHEDEKDSLELELKHVQRELEEQRVKVAESSTKLAKFSSRIAFER